MKLKTFRAANMPKALALVKQHLGSDAVIVHTRTFKQGGMLGLGAKTFVEITARKPEPSESARPPRVSAPASGGVNKRLVRMYSQDASVPDKNALNTAVARSNRAAARIGPELLNEPAGKRINLDPATIKKTATRAADISSDISQEMVRGEISQLRQLVENLVREQRQLHAPQMPEQLFDIYLDLIQREVADEIAKELIQEVQRDMTGNQIMSADLVRQKIVNVLDNIISTAGPICENLDGRARVVVLIGPTGVGKTTSIAKIAANLKLRQNKKVGLITIDTYRIGAVDQLRMYAQIIDVPLQVVLTPSDLRGAIDAMSDKDVILIDTAGRSQNDELKMHELKTFLNAAQPDEIHLVISSTANQSHMLSAVEKFKSLGVDRIILTKLDEAISFGVILSVMKKMNASISYITTGQSVPDDIEVAVGRKLARMLLGMHNLDGMVSAHLAKEYTA